MATKPTPQCDADNGDTPNQPPNHLWDSPLGQQTLAFEAVAMAPFVRRLHGDVIIWAGEHPASANALQRCMVRHSCFLQQSVQRGQSDIASLGGRLEALPFKSNSIDAFVLHHALEDTADPRVALREVTRVLAPGGRLLISGFNPMSIMGLRRLYARFFADSMSGQQLVNPLRLFDWLTLLGFELDVRPLYCGYGLPFSRLVTKLDLPLLDRHEHASAQGINMLNLPFAGLLLVSAVKQAVPMKPQRVHKKSRHTLAPVAYPSVSSWRKTKS
ncbi:MAG: class I SAM-dependent methyltransferase [bacterium]